MIFNEDSVLVFDSKHKMTWYYDYMFFYVELFVAYTRFAISREELKSPGRDIRNLIILVHGLSCT